MNSTIYPSGVDDSASQLCARKECCAPRTEESGLCLPCELRYNTTQEQFGARLARLLRQGNPSTMELDIYFAEQRRRAKEQK